MQLAGVPHITCHNGQGAHCFVATAKIQLFDSLSRAFRKKVNIFLCSIRTRNFTQVDHVTWNNKEREQALFRYCHFSVTAFRKHEHTVFLPTINSVS